MQIRHDRARVVQLVATADQQRVVRRPGKMLEIAFLRRAQSVRFAAGVRAAALPARVPSVQASTMPATRSPNWRRISAA